MRRSGKAWSPMGVLLWIALLLAFLLSACTPAPAPQQSEAPSVGTADAALPTGTPLAQHGQLRVRDGKLNDAAGRPFQLRGLSTHGLCWYPQYINAGAMASVRAAGGNVLRVAMYTEPEGAYYAEPERNTDLVIQAIENARAMGLYVLVDWHILNDGDPNDHLDRAITFFDRIASSYPGDPAVLYEVCNEPNGVNWSEVLEYGYAIVPVIRQYSPEAVIVLGTPDYCADLGGPLDRPPPWENCLCAWHWYAGEHGSRRMLEKALEAGLPVMVSEWGVGKNAAGEPALEQGREFAAWLNEKGVSWCAWSLCNKDEVYSVLRPDCKKLSGWTPEDLSPVGALLFAALKGE